MNAYASQSGHLLRKKGYKLAVVESCTGGLIGHMITNIPGSSDYYLGSITAYANQVKQRLLGVQSETLVRFGAVSQQTVLEMAWGIRQVLSADFPLEKTIGIAVSGIAGPSGGMPGKPVGLVWVALSAEVGNWAWGYHFNGRRLEIKKQTAHAALGHLIEFLKGGFPSAA